MYFLTIRGESRIWSLSQVHLQSALRPKSDSRLPLDELSALTSAETGGRPTGLDLQR